MKKFTPFGAVIFVLVISGACDAQREQAKMLYQEQEETVTAGFGTVPEVSGPSWKELDSYNYAQKEKALQEYQEALNSLDAKIEELEQKVAVSNPEIPHSIKEGWKEDTENLRLRRDKLVSEYDKLRKATAKNWPEAQTAFNSRWKELQDRWQGEAAE